MTDPTKEAIERLKLDRAHECVFLIDSEQERIRHCNDLLTLLTEVERLRNKVALYEDPDRFMTLEEFKERNGLSKGKSQ